MGSFSPLERLLAGVGKRVKSSLPCLRTVPSQSFTVAVLAISAGAALKASLISVFLFDVAPLPTRARATSLGDSNTWMLMASVDDLEMFVQRTQSTNVPLCHF